MSTEAVSWSRSDQARRLAERRRFDLLVVGGGITGVGVALDGASRGLSVALVEQADLAAGTSSRSTKLFHGGIRYLPHFEFSLVGEGLREQRVLAEIADFLYQPLEFIIPLYRQHGLADVPRWASHPLLAPRALRAGLVLYDLLGGPGRPGRRHRHLDRAEVAAVEPLLRTEGLRGGYVYSDAQTDDARLVVSVAKTAVAEHGAVVATRVRADRVDHADGRLRVSVTDLEEGETFPVEARAVVAATGAFAPPPGPAGAAGLRLVTSRGSHLLVDRDTIGLGERALVLPETDDGRVLFLIPWLGHVMIGTTDTLHEGPLDHPRASPEDVSYLVRHVARYLQVEPFQPLSVFAGLRALADRGGGSTARASREHEITEVAPGYVQVAGGKLTTYRRIARQATDRALAHLRIRVKSRTERLALVGAGADRAVAARALTAVGLTARAIEGAWRRYGGEAVRLAELIGDRPELATPLGDGATTLADVVVAVRQEGAARLSDVALRRSHLAWFAEDHGRGDAEAVSRVMAGELGWTEDRRLAERAAFESELEAEGL